MRLFATLAFVALLSACAQMPPAQPPIVLGTQFDAEQARALLLDGVNVVKGNAFMRQRGGGVVTCAGSTVYLIPATEYAKHRIRLLYATTGDSGSNKIMAPVRFDPDPPEYKSLVKTTRCDAQGNFTFDRVADGEFFVQTTVAWEVAQRVQGGNLMHRVKVTNGQVVNLVLSS